MDLRNRVLAAVDRGTPREEIVRSLGVSQPSIRRYLRLRREMGSVAPKPLPKRLPRVGATAESSVAPCGRSLRRTRRRRWRSTARCGRSSTGCGCRWPR